MCCKGSKHLQTDRVFAEHTCNITENAVPRLICVLLLFTLPVQMFFCVTYRRDILHPCSLIRVFAGHFVGCKGSKQLQTDRVFAERTCNITENAVTRLMCVLLLFTLPVQMLFCVTYIHYMYLCIIFQDYLLFNCIFSSVRLL